MLYIQCTKKLAEELQSDAVLSKPTESHPIYSWHAHFFILNRRKSVLVMNNMTRYNFMLTGLKKADFLRLKEVVVQGITENLIADNIEKEVVEQYIRQCGEVAIAASSERSIISQINEMISTIKYWNEYDKSEGIERDLYKLNRQLNRFIMMKLPKHYSGETMRDELGRLDEIIELDKMETEKKKVERQEENKYKAENEAYITLQDALIRLTKEELHQIRSQLQIKQTSGLNKQELIEVLCREIPDKVQNQIFMLDEERFRIIQKAAANEGFIFISNMEDRQLEYFQNCGLLFLDPDKDKQILVMPNEILNIIKDIQTSLVKTTIRKNTEWIKLSRGLLYYYGTLGIELVKSKLQTYMGTKMGYEFVFTLNDSIEYYGGIKQDSFGFSNARVFSSEQVQQEHLSRPELKYYPFSKADLILAGEPEFVDRNLHYQQFVDFLVKHFDMANSEADLITEECVYAIRIGQAPADILTYLQYQIELTDIDQIKVVMGKLIDLMNHTRQWFLKGHAPNGMRNDYENSDKESNVIDFRTKQKIGRNDPCPCGSGKKYKKCCWK